LDFSGSFMTWIRVKKMAMPVPRGIAGPAILASGGSFRDGAFAPVRWQSVVSEEGRLQSVHPASSSSMLNKAQSCAM
jgi:hypothetical protein